jgi:hypothetical protein
LCSASARRRGQGHDGYDRLAPSVRVHFSELELLGRRHAGADLAEALYAALHCRISTRVHLTRVHQLDRRA